MFEYDEISADLPKDWRVALLGELVEDKGISYGIVQPGNHSTDGVPIVRVKDLKNGRIDTSDPLRVAPDVEAVYARTRLNGGEVLLSLVGSVGESAVATERLAGWNVARAIAVLRTNKSVSANWLHICLSTKLVQHHIRMFLNTTVQATLNLKDVRRLPIVIPPRKDMEAIAAILDTLDSKIAVNDRIAATYDELFRAKFATLDEVKEGDCSVNELVEFNPRTARPACTDAVYVDMAALPTRHSTIQTWARRPPKGGSRFQNGDTLLARITPCLENGKTGYVDFLLDGETGTGSTEFIVMRSKAGVPSAFSYFLARDERFREHAIRKMVGSSGRQRVSAADVSNFFVRRPDPRQLSAFGAEVGMAFRHLKSVMDESRILERLRNTLLPELMSGRLRVRDAEKVLEEAV